MQIQQNLKMLAISIHPLQNKTSTNTLIVSRHVTQPPIQGKSANYQPTSCIFNLMQIPQNSKMSAISIHPLQNKPSTNTIIISRHVTQPPIQRKSANYQPTSWNFNFLQSLNNINADQMCYKEKAKILEEEIRCMINRENREALEILEMVDHIQRLGLGHRFQNDINKILQGILCFEQLNHKNLHQSALTFRLLRQHGFSVSQEILKYFMDQNGKILPRIEVDTKGILSLYEASSLAFEGECLLDKARLNTSRELKNIQSQGSEESYMKDIIAHALELPVHRRMVMLEARWYIESYGKGKDANQKLLELSKLEFNMTQSVLQRELKDMSRWWNSLGIANKLQFSRDRLVECFFWSLGMVSDPQLGSCREGLTKVSSFITTIDDVYDVYGTINELELFTDAVDRWDVNAMRYLPDYMKLCFLAFFNTINEMAYGVLKGQGEEVISYLQKSWADLFKTFLQEAKWSINKYKPSFKEYLENGWRSVSGTVLLIHAYFFMGGIHSKEAFNLLCNYHELLKWSSIIFRLLNDMATSSAEINRGETINAISCYMYESGVSEKEARDEINKLIDDAWKKLNELLQMNQTPFPKSFVETAINLARIAQCTYQDGDSHGFPDSNSKNRVMSLIIDPIL